MKLNTPAGERTTLTLPSSPEHDLAVFIGRFQPFHNGHLHIVREALRRALYLLIVIGSANESRRPDHLPFTAAEREQMIRASLTAEENERVFFKYAEDLGNMTLWTEQIQGLAQEVCEDRKLTSPKITLIGHSKDRSSYYLTAFPQWDSINVEQHQDLSATPMREQYLNADNKIVDQLVYRDAHGVLPEGVRQWLVAFRETQEYKLMVQEWDFMKKYLAPYNAKVAMPDGKEVQLFPPKFVTVDNVVIQAGHVLLIQRKSFPGKDLWALPGGHLDDDEIIVHASIRELREETRLKVPESVLHGSIIGEPKVFDHPNRSMRKRTITHATLYHLQPKVPVGRDGKPETDITKIRAALDFPKVKAKSDAKQAVWVALSDIKRDQMFEDHYMIIQTMKARINPEQ